MTAWGLLIHAQLTHNLKIFLEKASKSFFEQSKLSSLSPATKLSDSKLSVSANAPWQPDKNLTEPYTRAMHPTVSDLVSACVSNAVFGTSIGPETNKKMLIAADTDVGSQYVVRNDTDLVDTGLTQTDRQTKDNLSVHVGQQIIAVPCKQVTTTPSLVVQKSLPELSESCNELLGTLRTRSQTQPSIPCLISDLAGDSSQNVTTSPASKVENTDILKTDEKAMKMQETNRPFPKKPQNILKTSGEKDTLGVNAGKEGKIVHGKTIAFKLPECKIIGSVTDIDKLESVDSDKLLDLSKARNERVTEVSSVNASVLAVQDKQVDKETGSVTDSEKQCSIGIDDTDKLFKSNKTKTLVLKEGASASAAVLAVQENKADMETESASDIKERCKTGIVESDRLVDLSKTRTVALTEVSSLSAAVFALPENKDDTETGSTTDLKELSKTGIFGSDRLFDLSKARTVALTEGTSVSASVLALPKNKSDIETGRVGEVEKTGREPENKDDTETGSVGVSEKIGGAQGIQEINNCDADDDMGNEKIEPCCDTQGCGITIIPGSHQRLQKCCNAVVPKKRKRHFETKHMPFSWSSSKYAKRRMLQGSRERQYSGSKSTGSSTIYIDVEPAHYGPETTSTSSSTESTLHVTQTPAAGERVLTSQGKPRSLILKPGAVFSIPFTYSIPVSKSSKLLVPARTPQQPLAASSLDSSGSHDGQTGSKSSNTVDQEMVQSITDDVTNVTEEIDVIPILEETRRRKYPTSKPFKCEVCSLAFNQRIHLKKHMSKHTGITVLPAKSDSYVMFCLQSYQGFMIDRSSAY